MNLAPAPAAHRPERHGEAIVRIRIIPFQGQTAGMLYNRALKTTGINELLVSRLVACGNRRLRVLPHIEAPGSTTTAPPYDLTVAVEKAYIQTLHDTKTAVVVLRVENAGHVQHLRGQDTGLNWFNSGEEMAAALEQALDRALAHLRPHLPGLARPDVGEIDRQGR